MLTQVYEIEFWLMVLPWAIAMALTGLLAWAYVTRDDWAKEAAEWFPEDIGRLTWPGGIEVMVEGLTTQRDSAREMLVSSQISLRQAIRDKDEAIGRAERAEAALAKSHNRPRGKGGRFVSSKKKGGH